MALISRFGACAGMAAALSMASTSALAADAPAGLVKQTAGSFDATGFESSTYDSDADISEWRRYGWRRGGWHRHRRVDAGDVLAGVLIIGGIAAIASAASNNKRRRDREVVVVERDRDYDRDYDRRDNRRVSRNESVRGLDRAIDQCVDEVSRNVRVDSVDSADRTARGWIVSGALFNGSGFTCRIDNNGRIDEIDYGSFGGARDGDFEGDFGGGQIDASGEQRADGQYDDATYLAARRSVSGNSPDYEAPRRVADARSAEPLVPLNSDRQPAYPGGPLPGEDDGENDPQ